VNRRGQVGEEGDRRGGCHFCGGEPTVSLKAGGQRICRECRRKFTEEILKEIRELSWLPDDAEEKFPIRPDDSLEDDEAEWARRRSASRSRHRLLSIQETIDGDSGGNHSFSWNGGPADKPPTQMTEDLARICALLERNGYEVSVTSGIDRDLAAEGRLGRFHAAYDADRPCWTARVEFQKIVAP
jgi:hypothetical protein